MLHPLPPSNNIIVQISPAKDAIGPRFKGVERLNVGALLIRIGIGGILYYNHNKEPPKPILIIKALH